MRINLVVLAALFFSLLAKAADPMWFVSVGGENMQLISGASVSEKVADDVFLPVDFVGTEFYVRVQEGYELDGFRSYESSASGETLSSVSESMDAAVSASESEKKLVDEFGPLVDSGLQYYFEDDYYGWSCSHLYAQPLGDRVYRLRCDDKAPMQHSN